MISTEKPNPYKHYSRQKLRQEAAAYREANTSKLQKKERSFGAKIGDIIIMIVSLLIVYLIFFHDKLPDWLTHLF